MSYQSSYPPPQYVPEPFVRTRMEPAALTALLLAMLSIFVPFIPSVTALFLVPGANRNIAQSNGTRTGKGAVIAALIISILTFLLWALILATGFFTGNY